VLSALVNSKPHDTDSRSLSTKENLEITQGGRLPLNRFALFFLPAIIGAGADLWTKSHVFAHYFVPERYESGLPQFAHWWIDGVFGIQTSTNPGALFGIGKGYSTLFAIFSGFALVGILIWLFPLKAAFDRWLTVAMGLVTGGIVGNFYDRVGWGWLPEYPDSIRTDVRDWILFRLEGVPFFDPWPNFNIADAALVTGAIMLFIHALFFVPPPERVSEE